MSFALTTGGQGTVATAQVVWSFNSQTYDFRSDNNFLSWITTIFEVADAVTGGLALTNPLILPDGGDVLGYSLNTLNNNSYGGGINLSGSPDDSGQGGSIIMNAGVGGNAGSINTSSNDGATGGSINTNSDEESNGGNISTFGGGIGLGGSIDTSNGGGLINTSGADGNSGGEIVTKGGVDGNGGSINTSNGGGSINTQDQGSIGLGNFSNDAQTLITGTATVNRTATFPDNSGTIALVLKSSVSITFGVCAGNGAVVASSQTVASVAVGDAVVVTCTTDRTTLTAGGTSNIIFDGVVTASNTVSVRAHNPHNNSITLGALGFKIIVFKL